MVHAELQPVHRPTARALWRRRVPDAGRYFGDGRPGTGQAICDVLADPAGRLGHPHEALQAGLGHGRLGVRRAPPAIREVLRRRLLHHSQPLLSRDRLERVQHAGREADGELRPPRRRQAFRQGRRRVT